MEEYGTWLVRVSHNKIAVGVFWCRIDDLPDLVDEVCGPNGCEFKPIAPGGFIFEEDLVLHKVLDEIDPETDCELLRRFSKTEELFYDLFDDVGNWVPIRDPRFADES